MASRLAPTRAASASATRTTVGATAPRATEAAVQTPAISQARSGRARIIGMTMTSGVIGKTELSVKLTNAMIPSAQGCSAMRKVQS